MESNFERVRACYGSVPTPADYKKLVGMWVVYSRDRAASIVQGYVLKVRPRDRMVVLQTFDAMFGGPHSEMYVSYVAFEEGHVVLFLDDQAMKSAVEHTFRKYSE